MFTITSAQGLRSKIQMQIFCQKNTSTAGNRTQDLEQGYNGLFCDQIFFCVEDASTMKFFSVFFLLLKLKLNLNHLSFEFEQSIRLQKSLRDSQSQFSKREEREGRKISIEFFWPTCI